MKQVIEFKEENVDIVESAEDLFKKIKKINIDYSQENVLVIYLSGENIILDLEVLFKGGLNTCDLDFKILFRNALLKSSTRIIVAHNHPTGNLKPSKEDKKLYNKMKRAGTIIGVQVLDNIIFNKKEFYSLLYEEKS